MPSKAELDAMIADARRMQHNFDAQRLQNEIAKSLLGVDAQAMQKQIEELKKTLPDAFSLEKMKDLQHEMEQLQKEFHMQTMD